jgi:hypothetical protein
MTDLATFVRARLNERASTAHACSDDEWSASGIEWGDAKIWNVTCNTVEAIGTYGGGMDEDTALHAAANDPAYVLRDIAAKRAIVDAYEFEIHQAAHAEYWQTAKVNSSQRAAYRATFGVNRPLLILHHVTDSAHKRDRMPTWVRSLRLAYPPQSHTVRNYKE